LQAKAPGVQGPARRVAAADAIGELEATVAIMVLDTGNVVEEDGRDDIVFEKVGSCKEVSDIVSIDVVFVKVGSCAVEGDDGGGTDVVLAKLADSEEAVGGTILEVGDVGAVMTAEKRVVLQEDIEEAVGVSIVVVVIFTTCRRREEDGCVGPIIVATVTKSVSTTVDVDSTMMVEAEVLGSKTEYDVVTLANGPGVGIVDGIVVLEAVLFGALLMSVNPIPGLGG
jgi:hypothetical protein